MLRHTGKGRTYSHNLKLASLLSCVAGFVNITGVLALRTLTTNLTGHFAYMAEELSLRHYGAALVFLLYVLFFLLGAFTSGLLLNTPKRSHGHSSYVLPLSLEIAVLLAVATLPPLPVFRAVHSSPLVPASALLFAMGLQNALVTQVSQSVVRTTHLTGLFTDLGIELAKLRLRLDEGTRSKLHRGIILKLSIIAGFFIGGIGGGFAGQWTGIQALYIPAGILLFTLWYDRILLRYYHLVRHMRKGG